MLVSLKFLLHNGSTVSQHDGEVHGDFREERVFVLRTERWVAWWTSQWRASQAEGMPRAEVWWYE